MLAAEGARAPQFLFFARHYNDIDHTVPVIWGLIRNGIAPSRIRYVAYVADPSIEPKRDARLAFLARQGVSLETPYLTGGLRSLLHSLSAAPFGKFVRRKSRKILFRKLVCQKTALTHALNAVHEAPENSLVIADHSLGEETETILDAARNRSFPTVCLPHSFQFHFGFTDTKTEEALATPSGTTSLVECFDHVIVGDAWQKEIATKGNNGRGRLKVFGLPRFDPQWIKQLCTMYPADESGGNELKVLVIPEKSGLNINGTDVEWLDVEEQFRAVEFLVKHPGIHVRIKGNARGVSYRQSRLLRSFTRYLAEDAIPTSQLISWADLSVGCCSSVFMDAYVRNKPALLLEYATRLKMAPKMFGFDANPDSYEGFMAKVNKLVECRGENLYDEKSLQQMIEYYVYGGQEKHSVVDAYADFLQSLIN